MAKRTISKFVSLGALGLLVIIFGFIFLIVAAPLFANITPHTGGFVFAVSRHALTILLAALLMAVAAALFFFARALRRRHLN